jgi:excisionase family DNA binding protein
METNATLSDQSLYTRKEAASKLRISVTTIDKLISDQKLPSASVGKKVFINSDQLMAFIQKGGTK